ncbi:MAG: insulinase family protein [Planctomycetes bacterium]|nr:insulinase family protein [Planctomycetota bacterium]
MLRGLRRRVAGRADLAVARAAVRRSPRHDREAPRRPRARHRAPDGQPALLEKVKQEGTPYLDATVGTAGGFELLEGGDLTVECEPARWEEALTAAIVDLRTALEFGFQQPELDEVRAGMLRALDEAVEREPTAPSAALREALLQAAEDDVVPTDAKTDRDILRPVLEALTVEDCHAALVDEWSGEIRTLTAAGSLKLDDAPKELERVRAAAFDVDLEAPAEIAAAAFAYASDPERTGEVVQHDHVEDLDLHLVRFANGVQLNVKRTDFKERQILVRARVGDGRLGAAPEQLPAVELAGPTFSGGGLEAHSADDLRRLLAGKQVGVTLGVEDDHLALGGSTTGEDLLLELELLCAYLEHPGYRPDVLNVIDAQLPLIFEQYRHTVQGPLVFEFLPKLFTGNPRIGLLGMTLDAPLEKLQQVDMSGVRDLLAPQLATGPIEVSLVGDLDVDEAIALAARTLGTLPTRAAPADTSAARAGGRVVPGVEVKRAIETADEKATVVMIFPTTDGSETPTRRNLFFLGQVVNDRLRVEVRERLGAAYSPFAASEASRTWDGVGGLMIQANGEPHQVDALVAACKAVGQDLAENGVGAEEVQRLAEPLLKQLRDLQRENTFWLGAIDTAQSRPESLDEHRNLAAFYEHLDAEALSALAARFLGAERASTLIVVPKTEESSGQ